MKRTLRLWPIGLVLLGTMVVVEAQQAVRVTNTPLAATQSGTWTVQPGNTANTTPWLFQIRDAAGNARGANVDASNRVATTASAVDSAGNDATDTTNHAFKVNIVAGGGTGGTALADGGTFTAGATTATPLSGFYESSPTTCTTGKACAAGLTANRELKVSITSNSAGSAVATVNSLANVAIVSQQFWPLKSGVTSAMTGTTSTSVVAAVASNYLYISSCSISNAHASVDTLVNLQDGSGGTTLWTFAAAHGYGGESHTFQTPLKVPTLGNALFAADVTTGASVIIACQGFASTVSF